MCAKGSIVCLTRISGEMTNLTVRLWSGLHISGGGDTMRGPVEGAAVKLGAQMQAYSSRNIMHAYTDPATGMWFLPARM